MIVFMTKPLGLIVFSLGGSGGEVPFRLEWWLRHSKAKFRRGLHEKL